MRLPANSGLRFALGLVLPGSLATAALLPLRLYRSRLPDPLATHWSLLGEPNGAMSLQTLAMLVAALALPATISMGLLAYRPRALRGEISQPLAIAGFVAGLIAIVSWLTVTANLDAASWTDAAHLSFLNAGYAVAGGTALAAILARISCPLETAPTALPDAPLTGTAPGSRVMWVGSARAGWAAPLAVGCLALGVVLSRVNMVAAVGAGLTSLAGLWFTSIRMTVDRHGVRIAYGPLRWPVQRISLAEVRQAAVLDVRPMAWGGWGYRGSMRVLKRAAVVLRGGEGVKLDLTGDRTLVVTIDDARQAAGLINDLVSTRR